MNFIKRQYNRCLQKICRFEEWHINPVCDRPYAQEVIKMSNNLIKKDTMIGEVTEVGCGLGDIIAEISISNRNKTGYDISQKVIIGAKLAHPLIKFEVGSFEKVRNKTGLLIAVNFLHEISPETVNHELNSLIQNNDFEYIMIDKLPSPPYKYEHDFDGMMDYFGFQIYKKSKGFGAASPVYPFYARRHIIVYKKDK